MMTDSSSLPPFFSADDLETLRAAVGLLEGRSFAMTLAAKVGTPVEHLLRLLPARAQSTVGNAVNKALEQCLKVALSLGTPGTSSVASRARAYDDYGGDGCCRWILRACPGLRWSCRSRRP